MGWPDEEDDDDLFPYTARDCACWVKRTSLKE